MSAEVEETLQRIKSHKGVEGILIVNRDGVTLKSTLDEEKTREYAASLSQNDLTFLRVRSKKHEIMIAPDKEYMLIVIQNPNIDDK